MEFRDRFKELMWFEETTKREVGVVGVGGIGSWLTILLSRMGCKSIFVFDDDTLEVHNLGGQAYGKSGIGMSKVEALKSSIEQLSDFNILTYQERYTPESITSNVMFSAVDNMAARKMIFERWCELYEATKNPHMIYIDGRMLAENLQIFTVTPDKIEEYKKTLFEDSEVAEQPCTAKATSHCGTLISSLMVGAYSNWLTNLNMDIRVVPFRMSFDIALMDFNKGNNAD